MTLEVRESRSSLAGVMLAAAMEGVGVAEFVRHMAPHLSEVGSAVTGVLSQINLPAIRDLVPDSAGAAARRRWRCRSWTRRPGRAATAAPVVDAAAAAARRRRPRRRPRGPRGPGAAGGVRLGVRRAGAAGRRAREGAGRGGRRAARRRAARRRAARRRRAAGRGRCRTARRGRSARRAPRRPPRPAPAAAEARPGSGSGPRPVRDGRHRRRVSPEARAVLASPNMTLDADGKSDFEGGRIDPRLAAVVLKLAQDHKLSITCTARTTRR